MARGIGSICFLVLFIHGLISGCFSEGEIDHLWLLEFSIVPKYDCHYRTQTTLIGITHIGHCEYIFIIIYIYYGYSRLVKNSRMKSHVTKIKV